MPLFAQVPSSSSNEINDIELIVPTIEAPLWPFVLAITFGLVFIAAIVWLIRYLMRNRRQAPQIPPGRRVKRELERLSRHHDELTPNQFALALSEALKDYLSARFRDPVRYETAEEFLNRISQVTTQLPPAALQELRDFLFAAEAVKFGQTPDHEQLTQPLLHSAVNLVTLCESVSAKPSAN